MFPFFSVILQQESQQQTFKTHQVLEHDKNQEGKWGHVPQIVATLPDKLQDFYITQKN